MTGKYERNIEDIERARLEENRLWSQRNQESTMSPYGTGAVLGSYSYPEPVWNPQSFPLNPAIPFYGPQLAQQNQPFSTGILTGLRPTQPSFAYVQGLSGQQIFPVQSSAQQGYLPQSQIPFHPQQNPFLQAYPQPFVQPFMNPYPHFTPQTQTYGQFDTQWSGQQGTWESGQRNPFVRQASRAFLRPPRGYKRSDELIRDEICKRLAMTAEIDATDVEVIVKDGEVTLKGLVDDRFSKRIVEDITETTFGVRDVLNEIRLGSRMEHELSGISKGKEK